MKYTAAQECAIHFGNGNLLLSAAAGSGKTAALTGRIVGLLIENKAELGEMLIVTYTRAAAAEMKSRIAKKLREAAADGIPVGKHLAALQSADISTIHSFLYKSLKPYFGKLGLSADFRIADPKNVDRLKAEVMRDITDDYFSGTKSIHDPDAADFITLVDVIGQARDTAAVDARLLGIAEYLNSRCSDEGELIRYADKIRPAGEQHDTLNGELLGFLCETLSAAVGYYLPVLRELYREFYDCPKVMEKYGPAAEYIISYLSGIEKLIEGNAGYQALQSAMSGYAPPALKALQAKDKTDCSDRFKFYRDQLNVELEKMREDFFAFSEEEIQFSAGSTARILRSLSEVIHEYRLELERRKKMLSMLEYSDLESMAMKLLLDESGNRTTEAAEIGEKYRYIFIDEYQDTNYVQDRIFQSISGGAARFMVGDIKQSIYRFRGAEPEVFAEYRNRWDTLDPNSSENSVNLSDGDLNERASDRADAGGVLFMRENFRCDKPVIDFVNLVSDYTLRNSRIPYNENDALVYAKIPENTGDIIGEREIIGDGKVDITIIDRESRRGRESHGSADKPIGSGRNIEAVWVAREIKRLLDCGSIDGKTPLKPSDIAIIMRSPSSPASASNMTAADEYKNELAKYGIQAASSAAKPITEYSSVMLLLCLMNTVDNPLRDIYLAGAIKSPIFGFTVSDITTLRMMSEAKNDSNMPLYFEIESLARNSDGGALSGEDEFLIALREKCTNLVSWIGEQRTISRGVPADRYLDRLIHESRIMAIPEIRDDPAESEAVSQLKIAAHSFELSNGAYNGGLAGFLEYISEVGGVIESAVGQNGATSQAAVSSVSIMSIHSSKGLEFPVCFLTECAKKRNSSDERAGILLDAELGAGMYLPDEGGLMRCGNIYRNLIAEKIRQKSVDEEMRMLYVALTRARNKLYVTAKCTNTEKMLDEAKINAENADKYSVNHQGSYIEWIVTACQAHRLDDSFEIKLIGEGELSSMESVNAELSAVHGADKADAVSLGDGDMQDEGTAVISDYRYPGEYLRGIPSKLSVSKLHGNILDQQNTESASVLDFMNPGNDMDGIISDEDFSDAGDAESVGDVGSTEVMAERKPGLRPRFMTGANEVTAAERGSATHLFMQFADFDALYERGAEVELKRLIDERFISERMGELVNLSQIKRFAGSSLLEKMRRTPLLKREFRFNVLMNAANFTTDAELENELSADDVKITVQGVVDCVFRDPDSGELVLVDYKTDGLSGEEYRDHSLAWKKLSERHHDQLMYYKEICARMFGEDIASVLIYSTVLARSYDLITGKEC